MMDLWWRFRCMIGWHDWYHFNSGKVCESCGKLEKLIERKTEERHEG